MSEQAFDRETGKPKKKGKKMGNVLYFLLLALFTGVFLYCAIYIVNYITESNQQKDSYQGLSDLVHQYRDQATDPTNTLPAPTENTDPSETTATDGSADPTDATEPSAEPTEEPTEPTEPGILPEYQAIYELNTDLVGWITIPGTVIDYPVVQSPDDPDYYLKHTFEKEWSSWGCIYAREQCDVFAPSDNVVLYGHHMKDGSMFAQLDNYKTKSFWEEHQTFTFDTLYERHTYQIIAVFKTSGNAGEGFAYHLFNDAASEEEFNEFMETVHSLQFYDTGLTAEYGDQLLTLSTCEYTLDNGRFVVVAKRIS